MTAGSWDERLDREVGHGAGLGGRDVAGIAQDEDVVVRGRAQRLLVDRNEATFVPQTGVEDELLTRVQRDGDQQVEGQLTAVVRHHHLAVVVDPLDREVGGEADRAVGEQVAELRGRRTGLVKAPSSGVTYVMSTLCRIPRLRK